MEFHTSRFDELDGKLEQLKVEIVDMVKKHHGLVMDEFMSIREQLRCVNAILADAFPIEDCNSKTMHVAPRDVPVFSASSSNGKPVFVASPGSCPSEVFDANAASSSSNNVIIDPPESDLVRVRHHGNKIARVGAGLDKELFNVEGSCVECSYLSLSVPDEPACKRSNVAELRSGEVADVPKLSSDRLMPQFIDVSKLSSDRLMPSWCGKRAEFSAPLPDVRGLVTPSAGSNHVDNGRGKHEKRYEIIECVKLKRPYMLYMELRNSGKEMPCEVPGTPDPADDSISKRKWESLVSKWRAALRQVEEIVKRRDEAALRQVEEIVKRRDEGRISL